MTDYAPTTTHEVDNGPTTGRRAGEPVRLSLVNDYELVVAGLQALLRPHAEKVVVVDCTVIPNGDQVSERADVTLFDTFGRAHLGFEDLRRLIENPTCGRVVVYSTDDDPARIQTALALGAAGFLSKTATTDELLDAISRVAGGEQVVHVSGRRTVDSGWPGQNWGLTARESEVLAMLTAGLRNREIADALYVSVDTIKTHLRHIYRKLETNTRARTVAKALSDPSFARRHGAAG
jgi:NarL family two-component system response regulator LiaR